MKMLLRERPRTYVQPLERKDFWRKEPPVLNHKNEVIKGGFFAPQLEWWNLQSFIKALVAGYGSGKTFIGAKRDISQCLLNAPAPQLVVSPSYKIAKRTIIPVLRALCQGKASLDPTFSWRENKSDFEFTIRHGQRIGTIWVASGDEADSLKGPTVGSAHIDEPFVQDREVLDQCIARVRDPRAKRQEIILTGTPEQLNWGYDICAGDEKDDYDVQVVHAATQSNLSLAANYAQRMESAYSERAAMAFVGGLFINLSTGAVYYSFNDSNIVSLPDPGGALEVGMDFNVNPMAFMVFWRSGQHMHVIGEHEIENADTEYACRVLHEKYVYVDGARKGECRITNVYPDPTGKARATNAPGGKSDFHYIEEAGFTVQARSSSPRIRDRENAVNGKLRPKIGRPTLTMEPTCKRLKKYMMIYTHENKHKQKPMSHLLDALGYPVEYLYPVVHSIIEVSHFQGS
jgi:hypothetical protein